MITNLDELKWAIQKKVLVVGNKFSSGFLDELKKYCQVQMMDAYEDGMQQIFKGRLCLFTDRQRPTCTYRLYQKN